MSEKHQRARLSETLAIAVALLATDPEGAATAASEALDDVPGQPQSLLLLVSALRLMGAEPVARQVLILMAEEFPKVAAIHHELGLLLVQLGERDAAIVSLKRAVSLEQRNAPAWRTLAQQLALSGDEKGARRAYSQYSRLHLEELMLVENAANDSAAEDDALNVLRQAVNISPTDVFAIRSLGEVELRLSHMKSALAELERAVELAPKCIQSRYLYCMALTQNMEWEKAYDQLEIMIEMEPGDPRLESLLIGNFVMRGRVKEAVDLFDKFRPEQANNPVVWFNYALGARSLGKDSKTIVSAFQQCLALDPAFGAAWWGLADLKTYTFNPAEIELMRTQIARKDIPDVSRCHLEFALGTALESIGSYAEAFQHYQEANKLRHPQTGYDPEAVHRDSVKARDHFTAKFFADHAGAGCLSADPIFIVGMPRAGSTLVEQILASHSQVEGTAELPDLGHMVTDLIRKYPSEGFPALLDRLDSAELLALGEQYLRRTRSQRITDRPLFTDKAGSNYIYSGLIQTILPNAKIIDARRHPLACGFSCYKQSFAPGALLFAYDQVDIARYYRDYVEVMDAFDRQMPGRIHRVIHEQMLNDPEGEVRRMLDYCGLPFEEGCLRFYETERSVRTSSSEQVRQPIQKKSVEMWQNYENWLQPMKDVLGEILTKYPVKIS